MQGYITTAITASNLLQIKIPDELKDMELQVIILPMGLNNSVVDFFTNDEIHKLATRRQDEPLEDNEDYAKWL